MPTFSVNVRKFGSWFIFIYNIAASLVTESNCTEGDVRLIGGDSEYEGRVEVCVNKAWGTVCAYSAWSYNDAKVVCNQIGALTLGMYIYIYSCVFATSHNV